MHSSENLLMLQIATASQASDQLIGVNCSPAGQVAPPQQVVQSASAVAVASREYLPLAQLVQTPATAQKPGSQAAQADAPAPEAVSVAQSVHTVLASATGANFPAAHSAHSAAPSAAANLPPAQFTHSAKGAVEVFPAAQGAQAAPPVENLPAAQSVHVLSAVLVVPMAKISPSLHATLHCAAHAVQGGGEGGVHVPPEGHVVLQDDHH
jgi:hypothetical protein